MPITISGSGITSSEILDGTITNADVNDVAASKLTGALPAISGASLTNLPAGGVTEADQWRVTSDSQGNTNPITSNWERVDTGIFGVLGTGMTQSSGNFTFPSTGYWLVRFYSRIGTNSHSQGCHNYIHTTSNNSSYGMRASSSQGIYSFYGSYNSSADSYGTVIVEYLMDVTNTSTHKCRFGYGAGQGGEKLMGSSTYSYTYATFTRLGDT